MLFIRVLAAQALLEYITRMGGDLPLQHYTLDDTDSHLDDANKGGVAADASDVGRHDTTASSRLPGTVRLFCDYHGHSRQKNVFLYGCSRQQSWRAADRGPDSPLLPVSDGVIM